MYFGFTNFEVVLRCSSSRILHFRYCCCAMVWSVYIEYVMETAGWSGWEKSLRQVASKHSYTCVRQPVKSVACGRGTFYAVWKQPLWICMSWPDSVQCKVCINGSVVLTVSAINCILSENVILWGVCAVFMFQAHGMMEATVCCQPQDVCGSDVADVWNMSQCCTVCRLIDGWHSGRPLGRPADSSVAFVDGLIQEEWCVTMHQGAARAYMLIVVWCSTLSPRWVRKWKALA